MLVSPVHSKYWVIGTLILAFALEITPMPWFFELCRPAWLALFVAFWALNQNSIVTVEFIFFAGLLLDVLTGSLLGEHAFALVTIAYIITRFQRRMWLYHPWQQGVMVAIFTLMYQVWILWQQAFLNNLDYHYFNWFMCISNGIVWPFLWSAGTRVMNRRNRSRTATINPVN